MADKNLKMDFTIIFSVVVENTEQAREELVESLCDSVSFISTKAVENAITETQDRKSEPYPMRIVEGVDYEISCGEED